MTRRIALLMLLLLTFTAAAATAAPQAPRAFAPVQNGFTPSAESVLPYAPDRVMVQFTSDAYQRSNLSAAAVKNATVAGAVTGLSEVDALLADIGIKNMAKALRGPARKDTRAVAAADRLFRLDLDRGSDVVDVAARLAALSDVEFANPDWRAFPAALPDDPQYPDNWGHDNTAQLPGFEWGGSWSHSLAGVGTVGFDANAATAWNYSVGYGDPAVVIAIIDSGVDTAHPDLNIVAGYDYGDNDADPDDDSAQPGHGTACAGVAAAVADNNLGVTGVAGACAIMPLKVANSAGDMYFSAIIDAIYHAADNGADVISMSFGAYLSSDPSTDAALLYAWNAGCVNLAATGNENFSTISYPAINANVIAVGAASPCGDRKRSSASSNDVNDGIDTDPNGYTCDGERWWGSCYGVDVQDAGSAVDIIAPTILPTTDISGSGGYQSGDYEPFFNGTSCATPYAAGVAALIRSSEPALTASEIRTRIRDTAFDVVNVESVAGWDRYSGYGMIDADAAIAAGGTGPAAPSAEFSGDVTGGCVALAVNFTDESLGDVTSWDWTFGDGGVSTDQNPAYTYNVAGTYTVTMTATGPGGSDVRTRTDYITVDPTAVADFTSNKTTGPAPLSVFFIDASANDPIYLSWDFGDGGTSTAQIPQHTFANPGTYDVTLIATNACGPDTIVKTSYITVTAPAPTAAFTQDATTVCLGTPVVFTDQSTGDVTDWAWDFGDGNTSTLQNPDHTYAADGLYTVALTVTGSGGDDTLTMTDLITVTPSTVSDFSASVLTGEALLEVVFTDLTAGTPLTWAWDFGDGGTSTLQNPTHTFGTGTFTVSLTTTADCGGDTMTKVDMITVTAPDEPVAAFSADPTTLCAPGDVTFTDASTGVVTSWQWFFGDGEQSTDQNPVHTYAAAGVYDVTLMAFGPVAVDTLIQTAYITAEEPVTADFSASVVSGAPPLSVDFSDLSTGSPTAWSWDFGDAVTDTLQNPTHVYAADGTYTVTLTASNGCGGDTVVKTDLIVVTTVTGVNDTPRSFAMEGNAPNPFNPTTVIAFSLERDGAARLEIFDASGRSLGTLVNGAMTAGRHEITWQPVRQPSGVYFARLTSGGKTAIQRMVLIR